MEMKILITGGLGFIGSNLLNNLVKKKTVQKIIIIDNFSKSDLSNLNKDIKFKYYASSKSYEQSRSRIDIIKADTNDQKLAIKLTKGIDYVVYLAAESGVDISIKKPQEAFDINVKSTFNYIEASRINKVKRFVFASSCAVFGDIKPPHHENLPRKPISPYGSSKLSIETFCETYNNVFKLNTTILRFSNVYGNFSKHKESVVSKFIKNIINNKSVVINGDGKITRDYIHVDDICSAIYKCLKLKKSLQVYHVATGKETSLNDLVLGLKKLFVKYNKKNILVKHTKERIGDMKKNYSIVSKIKKEANWKSKVSLKNGLEKTISWYLN